MQIKWLLRKISPQTQGANENIKKNERRKWRQVTETEKNVKVSVKEVEKGPRTQGSGAPFAVAVCGGGF